MTKIGIIRCEKNENKCPLTACFTCLEQKTQAFKDYEQTTLAGVFTCRCDQDNVEDLAKILKAKGAEAIHVPTCLFANKVDGQWIMEGGGLCDRLDSLLERMRQATGLPCVMGSAHLPEGFAPEI
ncbi:CGGC domain-containing protein [Salidesulfovibrio onnuriiensis]|uniref:CGGC domain-containing protein n=1 Tax=Salidesulfovibrio onnuriiensis TaxID=2583823 RepID=UPI0011CCCA91|nr:CGGC domain-containing protein [Salidesulfovibrio onnuriiensis]